MVDNLNREQIDYLLETYTMDEILDLAELTHYDVLRYLYEHGYLEQLPDRILPIG